jgi:hypothetical protein
MSRRVWSRKFGQHVASAFSAFGVFACVIPPFGKRGGPSADAQDGTEEFACAITIDASAHTIKGRDAPRRSADNADDEDGNGQDDDGEEGPILRLRLQRR